MESKSTRRFRFKGHRLDGLHILLNYSGSIRPSSGAGLTGSMEV